ncbi:MAG: M3 family oligoendopeptidase, partial [Oscillospiraceae bacterium]
MKFSEMPYERPNLILLQENINKIISAINSAKSADEQIKLVKQFEETMKNFNTLSSICEARNAIDTRDKFYEDEHNYFDEISPLLEENYNAYYKSLLESKFRCEIQKVLGDVVFKNMEMQLTAFTPEIIPLMQKENALCSDYQKLYSSAKVPFKGEMYTIAQLGKFKQSDDRETRREAW